MFTRLASISTSKGSKAVLVVKTKYLQTNAECPVTSFLSPSELMIKKIKLNKEKSQIKWRKKLTYQSFISRHTHILTFEI